MTFLNKSKNNEKKALVRVLEIDSSGDFVKEVLGFGVRMRKNEETNSFMFITSSSVVNSSQWVLKGSKIVAERYCSQYPKHIDDEGHHEVVYDVISSVDDNVSFAFFSGQSEEGFLRIDDGTFHKDLAMHKTLYAYAFEGKELVELTFQDKCSSNDYKLAAISKKGFQVNKAKGAPIIAYYIAEEPAVVGILHTKSDGTLYPVFLTEKNLEVKEPKKQPELGNDEPGKGKPVVNPNDEKDSPIANDVKPDFNPAGGVNGGTEGNNSNGGNGQTGASLTDDYDKTIQPSDEQDVNPKDEKDSPIHNNEKQDLHHAPSEGNDSNGQTDASVMRKYDRTIQPSDAQDIRRGIVHKEQSRCYKYKTIHEALPDKLKTKLQVKLDPDRPLGGDIGTLADAYGYSYEEINFLKRQKYPTQEFLNQEGDSTLLVLRDKLKQIKRDDASKLIDDCIKNNCECEECSSLR